MSANVKIFVSHRIDQDSFVVEDEVFQPMRCGAVFDKRENATLKGDDTKDNISQKRESYCELTAQYWAWKNVKADYYGLCHYRRYLSFNEDFINEVDDWGVYNEEFLNSKSIETHGLDAKSVEALVEKYDLVTMIPSDLKKIEKKSVYNQYKVDGVRLHIEDLDLMLEIIDEISPEYSESAREYLDGHLSYLGNIFILKKDLFFEYSEWLFSILKEFDKRNVMEDYSLEGYRTPGHLGERLFGIYYTHLKKKGGYKFKELPLVVFGNTARVEEIKPAFEKNEIPVIFSSSEIYSPFLAATLQSLVDVSKDSNNYDIFVLEREISKPTKDKLRKILCKKKNFSLRFCNVKSFFSQYSLYEAPVIKLETYFRLVIPELFKEFDKIVYLDCDLILKRDVADLLNEDIGDTYFGAVLDVCGAGSANGHDKAREQYVREYLRLKKVWRHFNAGVLVMNCEKFRETFTTKYLLEFAEAGRFQFQDQDALNVLCEDNICWLDNRWNFAADPVNSFRGWVTQYAPMDEYKKYLAASKDPWIIHYAGNEKPWWFPNFEYADEFWTVFIKTPFYAQFMAQRNMDIVWQQVPQVLDNMEKLPRNGVGFKIRLKNFAKRVCPKGTFRRRVAKKIWEIIK